MTKYIMVSIRQNDEGFHFRPSPAYDKMVRLFQGEKAEIDSVYSEKEDISSGKVILFHFSCIFLVIVSILLFTEVSIEETTASIETNFSDGESHDLTFLNVRVNGEFHRVNIKQRKTPEETLLDLEDKIFYLETDPENPTLYRLRESA
jgi:hypothetical protein